MVGRTVAMVSATKKLPSEGLSIDLIYSSRFGRTLAHKFLQISARLSAPSISNLIYTFSFIILYVQSGWQKQGHTWHIVPRNYSSKVGLIDLIMEKIREKEEKNRRKMEKSEALIGF